MARKTKDKDKSKKSQSRPFTPNNNKHRGSLSDDGKYNRNRRKEPSACVTCLRGTMSVYNVIVLLVGLGGLGAGVWLMLKELNSREVTALIGVNMYEIASYLLIAGGGVVALLAFCGCCGTMREDKCVLGFYATTLTLMLIVLLSGCVLAFISKDHLVGKIKKNFELTISKKYGFETRKKSENRLITDAWDSVQREFKCCGVSGNVTSSQSWAMYKSNSEWYNSKDSRIPFVPDSCCVEGGNKQICTGVKKIDGPPTFGPEVVAGRTATNPHLHTDGCYEKVVEIIGQHALIIGLISGAIPLFLILGVVIACCLCFRVKKDLDDEEDDEVYKL